MQRAVIFDIDGTLADLTHRLHHISGKHKNYEKFFEAVHEDAPIEPIINLLMYLEKAYTILLVSGRPEKTREATEAWMEKHGIPYEQLFMRADADYRPDFIIKSQVLDGILADGYEIQFVVDDRPSVVSMWRDRGLTCLQCRDWDESIPGPKGLLTLMIGPSGAGKSTWLKSTEAEKDYGIHQSHIISSDQIRQDLCGDFKDQSKNDEVFNALHSVCKTRISKGLPTVVDATNLRRKDRLAVVDQADGGPVRYIVLNRAMPDKYRDGGWRTEIKDFDLIAKHEMTFNSNLKDILAGDHLPNVEVIDLRKSK